MSEKELKNREERKKKYEMTEETMVICGETLHRIRALKTFGEVEAGQLGGWIEKEENLSHEGEAWVGGDARVRENARVEGEACIEGKAYVGGEAWIGENAKVEGNARVGGKAYVGGDAYVGGEAWIGGEAYVGGNARVGGEARVEGDAWIGGNADIFSKSQILVIGPIGSRDDFTTFYRDKDNEITVKCGCFLGKIDEFLEKVAETHGDSKYALVYRTAVEAAKQQIDLSGEAPKEERNK